MLKLIEKELDKCLKEAENRGYQQGVEKMGAQFKAAMQNFNEIIKLFIIHNYPNLDEFKKQIDVLSLEITRLIDDVINLTKESQLRDKILDTVINYISCCICPVNENCQFQYEDDKNCHKTKFEYFSNFK